MPIQILNPSSLQPKPTQVTSNVLDSMSEPTILSEEKPQVQEADFQLETPTMPPLANIPDFFAEEDEDEDHEDSPEEQMEEILEESSEDQPELLFYDLLASFFKLNPSPTDDQVHALAEALGMEEDDLEAIIYQILSVMLEDENLNEESRGLISSNLEKYSK